MAHIKLNPAIESIRGKVGDFVYRTYEGRDVVGKLPDFGNRVPSDAQKAVIEKFRKAAGYGKLVMADAQARKLYEQVARARKLPLFSLIMQDFLNDPRIDVVDLSSYTGQAGEKIFVEASDDFSIAAVHVAIARVSGEPVESGEAALAADGSGRWSYTTTASVPPGTPVKVQVSVTDRPGHTVTKTETK